MKVNVTFSESASSFTVRMVDSSGVFTPAFGNVETVTTRVPVPGADVEVYEGSYRVTPKVEAQTLETANKFMQRDVSILSIPFYETSNNTGGVTAYIASEVAYGNQ